MIPVSLRTPGVRQSLPKRFLKQSILVLSERLCLLPWTFQSLSSLSLYINPLSIIKHTNLSLHIFLTRVFHHSGVSTQPRINSSWDFWTIPIWTGKSYTTTKSFYWALYHNLLCVFLSSFLFYGSQFTVQTRVGIRSRRYINIIWVN